MKIHTTPLSGMRFIELDWRNDSRGGFARLFCERELADILGARRIVQANYSLNEHIGSIRGMHFQHPPHSEMKFVVCVRGAVWDVAVDLRSNSATYLRWYGLKLSAEGRTMVVIPEGFAHGFQVIVPGSELIYFHTATYAPASEEGLRYDDPALGINWPITVGEVSVRDRNFALIDKSFTGVKL